MYSGLQVTTTPYYMIHVSVFSGAYSMWASGSAWLGTQKKKEETFFFLHVRSLSCGKRLDRTGRRFWAALEAGLKQSDKKERWAPAQSEIKRGRGGASLVDIAGLFGFL